MVAHLILASYVAILAYHVVYSGTIGNRRTISTADIGAAAAKERSVRVAVIRACCGEGPERAHFDRCCATFERLLRRPRTLEMIAHEPA